MSVVQAKALGLTNFSILVSHVRVPPAMHAILGSPQNRVQGFLAAGHVCAVMGYWEYPPIAERYGVPIVVTGFEPLDIVLGIRDTVRLLEAGEAKVANAYARAVTFEGNRPGQAVIDKVFESCDRKWRGVGIIPQSGWCLRPEFADFDAENRFQVAHIQPEESPLCIAGQILQGSQTAGGLSGLRQRMHARASAGRHDGLVGGCLRRLLSVRTLRRRSCRSTWPVIRRCRRRRWNEV